MKTRAKNAAAFAVGRAMAVFYGAIVALGLWALVLSIGPLLEAKFFPVISDYRITDVKRTPLGVELTPVFTKNRSGFYQGAVWEIVNENGDNLRVQAQLTAVYTAPETGPVGPRVGRRIFLPLPEGRQCFRTTYFHDTGFVWQSTTTSGPFCVGPYQKGHN